MHFFQAVVVSILLNGCTTWMLTKRIEKKLDGNCTRMLRAILNWSWKLHPTKLHLYGHLQLIAKTIQIRWTRHTGHCWRSKEELISDVLLWIPSHGHVSVGQPTRINQEQLCTYTSYRLKDMPEAIYERNEWRARVREIRACSMTW